MMLRNASRAGREKGLTMLELAFVMLVMGILASTLVPMLSDTHHKSMAEEDRRIVKTLKDVLIGQFLATGRLPTTASLGALPVRLTDSRNQAISYDVWDEATSNLTGSDKTTVCAVLDDAITSAVGYVPNQPAICAGAPDYDNNVTWATYCGTPQNIAFVLVASGPNRPNQSGEISGSTVMRPGNRNIGNDRVFERPERRQVSVLPGTNTLVNYDDIVEVVTLQELKARCPL